MEADTDRIRSLVAAVLQLPVTSIGADSSPEDLPEWDSVNHLTLMLAIEEAFGIEVAPEVAAEMRSPRLIAEYLSRT